MIISLKALGRRTVGIRRVAVAATGVAALGVVLYKLPVWVDAWSSIAVIGVVTAAVTGLASAVMGIVPRFWIYMQVLIVIFVVASIVIAAFKLS